VRYLSPERIGASLVHELAQFDLLTASLDDLGGMADPGAALDLLRSAFGRRPLLALTDGAAGARLDLPDGSRHHVVPQHVVSDVSMVGAGDAFAAILAAELGSGRDPLEAARSAVASTASLLASRHV
jgi:sugar/nucleoside kinase (ribokinase family)